MAAVMLPHWDRELHMPSLKEFIRAVECVQVYFPSQASDGLVFSSVSTDTRTLLPGALFIALSGPNFDGNSFVSTAKEKGAVAAVVTRLDASTQSAGIPLVQVADAVNALQQWAAAWRRSWNGRVVAVTGSNGKTTVKQMIGAIAAAAVGPDHAWATPGNLNNHIGLPLSVLGLRSTHQIAVLELGMNHPDEIAGLAAIASPHVALVNNAQREHQEFMKSVTAVAQENGQVFTALAADGVAVFPIDQGSEPIWIAQACGKKMIRFGFADHAAGSSFSGDQVLGQWEPAATTSASAKAAGNARVLRIVFPDQSVIHLKLKGAGDHFALNALAASACAFAAGIDVGFIGQALNSFEPVQGRGQQQRLAGGGLLVDDSYNANPDSVRAAIDALVSLPQPRALVLGDMGEVGDQGEAFHREVLDYAGQKEIDSVWLHGPAFGLACGRTGVGKHFDEITRLIEQLHAWVVESQARHQMPSVWIKGSRFMRMERVVTAMEPQTGEKVACC